MPLEVSTTRGIEIALTVPNSGIVTWKSESSSSRKASNSSSARSTSSISSTGGVFAPDRGEQRALEQIVLGEDMRLDRLGALARDFARLDRDELALIVPFVERRARVEPLVALHADELGAVHGGERLGDLGLADARLAFDQQRALQIVHHPERGREFAVGDIADFGEAGGDGFAGNRTSGHRAPPRSPHAGEGWGEALVAGPSPDPHPARRAALRDASEALRASRVQPQLLRRQPGPIGVMRHRDMRRAEELERVVDRIGEARHASRRSGFRRRPWRRSDDAARA